MLVFNTHMLVLNAHMQLLVLTDTHSSSPTHVNFLYSWYSPVHAMRALTVMRL